MIGWSKRQCGSIRPHKQAESSAERRREIQITVSLILVTIIVRENVKRSNFRLLGKTAVCLSGPIWTRRRFRLNRCVERFDQNKFSSRNFSTQESLYLAQKTFSGNLVLLETVYDSFDQNIFNTLYIPFSRLIQNMTFRTLSQILT